jgi:hypothetical protein
MHGLFGGHVLRVLCTKPGGHPAEIQGENAIAHQRRRTQTPKDATSLRRRRMIALAILVVWMAPIVLYEIDRISVVTMGTIYVVEMGVGIIAAVISLAVLIRERRKLIEPPRESL